MNLFPSSGSVPRAHGHFAHALALILSASLHAEDDSVIPHAWPSARYEQLKLRPPPFALSSAVEPKSEPKPSFAANWYVSGIARLDDRDFVTIKARDLSTEFSLFGHEAAPVNGVSLASIEWSESIGTSVVIVKRGNETARLEFNEAEMTGPAKVAPATPNPIPSSPAVGAQGGDISPIHTTSNPPPPRNGAIVGPNAPKPKFGATRLQQHFPKPPAH